MNDLTTSDDENVLLITLDEIQNSLVSATETWQQLRIRDVAAATAAAAKVIKRRDIQIKATNLMLEAERMMADTAEFIGPGTEAHRIATMHGIHNKVGGKFHQPSDEELTPKDIKEFRRTHKHITNDQFEDLKKQAIETGKPLTRNTLRKFGEQIAKDARVNETNQRIETDGRYGLINVHPPWKFGQTTTTNDPSHANDRYRKDFDELSKLNVQSKAKDDAVIYLWTPNRHLHEGIALLSLWGFKYCRSIVCVWEESEGLDEVWVQTQHNIILIGKRGNPTPPKQTISSVITDSQNEAKITLNEYLATVYDSEILELIL